MLADLAWIDILPLAAVVVDDRGDIVAVNPLMVDLFGYSALELLSMSIDQLVPDSVRSRHIAHRATYAVAPRQRQMAAGQHLSGQRRDKSLVSVAISLSPLDKEHTLALIESANAAQRAIAARYQERTDDLIAAQRALLAAQSALVDLAPRVVALERRLGTSDQS